MTSFTDLEQRIAAFPQSALEAVEQAIRVRTDRIAALIAETETDTAQLLEEVGAADAEGALGVPAADLNVDLKDALAPLAAVPAPTLASVRGDLPGRVPSAADLQKRLVAPLFAALEETVERATLAVSRAARSALDDCHDRARQSLASCTDAPSEALDPAELAEQLTRIAQATRRLRGYRDCTRQMLDESTGP